MFKKNLFTAKLLNDGEKSEECRKRPDLRNEGKSQKNENFISYFIFFVYYIYYIFI